MSDHWIIKLVIYALMLGIVFALGSGMYYLLFAKERSAKTVKALTFRIGLSLSLFILLFIAFAMGWVRPHSLFPIANTQTQTEITTPHPQSANTRQPLQKQNDAVP